MTDILSGYPETGTQEERLEWLKAKVVELHTYADGRIAALEARHAEVIRRMQRCEDRLREQERRIDAIEATLDAVRRGDVQPDEIEPLIPTRH